MKFSIFLVVFLLTVVVAAPFGFAAVERERDDRSRPTEEQTERPETSVPERDNNDETPQGAIVYNKNGVIVYVAEESDSTTVTVSVDGQIASKVTHTGFSENDDNNDGATPGEDGDDGSDGEDGVNNEDDVNEQEEQDVGRERPARDSRDGR